MNLRPVIEREMLVEARRPVTTIMRLVVALLGFAGILLFFLAGQYDHTTGGRLFFRLNSIFFIAIWFLIPLLTADALSQERRENTLGLLFLAGLTGREIVLGKSCAHALRGLNLLLVLAPFQVVPVILGGVAWPTLAATALVNFASILAALGAGMLAAAAMRNWWRALPLALLLAVLFVVMLSSVLFFLNPAHYRPRVAAVPGGPGLVLSAPVDEWFRSSWSERLVLQLACATGAPVPLPNPRGTGAVIRSSAREVLLAASLTALTALLLAGLAIAVAARLIKANWSAPPPSAGALRRRRFWCSVRFLRVHLRQRLSRAMNRNPVGWLHQRSWNARLTKWGWFLVVALLSGLLLLESANPLDLPPALRLLAVALLLSLAFTASNCFRRDLETGALELFLVSPLPDALLLRGRIRGIIGQYLPAGALLLYVWLAVYLDLPERFHQLQHVFHWSEGVFFVSTACTLVAVGAAQSLRQRTVLRGWLTTLGQSVLLPWLLAVGAVLIANVTVFANAGPAVSQTLFSLRFTTFLACFVGAQVLISGAAWYAAVTTLGRREMLFRPA